MCFHSLCRMDTKKRPRPSDKMEQEDHFNDSDVEGDASQFSSEEDELAFFAMVDEAIKRHLDSLEFRNRFNASVAHWMEENGPLFFQANQKIFQAQEAQKLKKAQPTKSVNSVKRA